MVTPASNPFNGTYNSAGNTYTGYFPPQYNPTYVPSPTYDYVEQIVFKTLTAELILKDYYDSSKTYFIENHDMDIVTINVKDFVDSVKNLKIKNMADFQKVVSFICNAFEEQLLKFEKIIAVFNSDNDYFELNLTIDEDRFLIKGAKRFTLEEENSSPHFLY